MRRARPLRVCDVPGCGQIRPTNHRLCRRCFARLPAERRVGINEAHHQRRWSDHKAMKLRAQAFLNLPAGLAPITAARTPTVSPQRAYELQARMLGERNDA